MPTPNGGQVLSVLTVLAGTDADQRFRTRKQLNADLLEDRDATFAGCTLGAGWLVPDLLDAICTPPMLSDRRVVLVLDFQAADRPVDLLTQVSENLAPDVYVVIEFDGDLPAAVSRWCEGAGITPIICGQIQNVSQRAKHVRDIAAKGGVTLDFQSAQLIAESFGGDLAGLDMLVSTLAHVALGRSLNVDDVAEYLVGPGEAGPFALDNAIDAGKPAEALTALNRILYAGKAPIALCALLRSRYQRALRYAAAGEAGMPDAKPGSIRASSRLAGKLGIEQIERALEWCAAADGGLKGRSGLPANTVLEVLVCRLALLKR